MNLETIQVRYDLVVVGGGMSGICAAIAAARKGLKTALIHNRPVLGGNASSEIRMHICGAAGFYCNRKNARETGIIEELLLENKHRNPNHNFSILDTVLWEKVRYQENLTLYLNCHVDQVIMDDRRIDAIHAIQLTTEKSFVFYAKTFVDTTGDALVSELAGARIMKGTESRDVFNEPHAPLTGNEQTMGNTLMFKAVDTGKPVPFKAPFWANKYTEDDLKHRDHKDIASGYWWIELGGTIDATKDYEEIRDELLKALYGVWDHIKNSGDHGAENWDLDWVQFLPGKRESRRVVGDYILTELDLTQGKGFDDTVAYGGWPIDTHTPMGITGKGEGPNRFIDVKDVYPIPYRCLYAADVDNLMVGGRAISASHLAFASARVMGTTAVIGQAIGTAAALQQKYNLNPRELHTSGKIEELQQLLLRDDCYLPGITSTGTSDLARSANFSASSCDPLYPVENLLTGISRPVGENHNLWVSASDDTKPVLTLKWDKPVKVSEIILKFDSDLNHDLMISIDKGVVETWRNTLPPSLVRSYHIDIIHEGIVQQTRTFSENCIRSAVEKWDTPTSCDEIRVTLLETYGDKQFRVFEIRVY